jgi:transposase
MKVGVVEGPRFGGANMQTVTTIGLDIAKSVFQVHGIDAEGQVIIRRQLRRRYVLAFFEKLCRAWSGSRPALRRIIGHANSGL